MNNFAVDCNFNDVLSCYHYVLPFFFLFTSKDGYFIKWMASNFMCEITIAQTEANKISENNLTVLFNLIYSIDKKEIFVMATTSYFWIFCFSSTVYRRNKKMFQRCLLFLKYFTSIQKILNTPRQKSIRALEIVLAIFLCFECQFLSFYACYKEYKA